MAITSESQILDTSKVYNATAFLSEAIGYLNAAKTNLKSAKNYASYDNFHTNLGNNFPENTDEVIKLIEDLVEDIKLLKSNVESKAEDFKISETNQYNAYLAEKAEEEKEGTDEDSDAYYKELPYKDGPSEQYIRL